MPVASQIPTSLDATPLDSHTISIVFGTIGVVFACLSLIVNIAFGLLQLRATNQRAHREIEIGKPETREPVPASVGLISQTAPVATASNQMNPVQQLGHELEQLRVPIAAAAAAVVRQSVSAFFGLLD